MAKTTKEKIMRLTDLDPKWLVKDGKRVGFTFKSPIDPKWRQACFENPPPRREQWEELSSAVVLRRDKQDAHQQHAYDGAERKRSNNLDHRRHPLPCRNRFGTECFVAMRRPWPARA